MSEKFFGSIAAALLVACGSAGSWTTLDVDPAHRNGGSIDAGETSPAPSDMETMSPTDMSSLTCWGQVGACAETCGTRDCLRQCGDQIMSMAARQAFNDLAGCIALNCVDNQGNQACGPYSNRGYCHYCIEQVTKSGGRCAGLAQTCQR